MTLRKTENVTKPVQTPCSMMAKPEAIPNALQKERTAYLVSTDDGANIAEPSHVFS